jgi:hypothetical protein
MAASHGFGCCTLQELQVLRAQGQAFSRLLTLLFCFVGSVHSVTSPAACCVLCAVQGAMVYEPPGSGSESALRHIMSGGMRRWVLYEWLYPAIDRPWFMKNELQVSPAGWCCAFL